MKATLSLAITAALLACCAKEPPAPAAGHGHAHGPRTALGDLKIGDHTIAVWKLLPIEAGKEADFDLDFPAGRPLPGTVRGWIGLESAQGSMKVRFEKETEARMHGHPEAPAPIPAGSRLWVEIETPEGTRTASIAYGG